MNSHRGFLMSIKHTISVAILLVAMQTGAMAAEKCYEETPVPASVNCYAKDSKSADFAMSCKHSDATVTKKEVDCPASWVNANGKQSQAQVCSAAGMKSSNIEGKVCAAGERRPSNGTNAASISYRFGRWGSGGGQGGSIVEKKSKRTSRIGDDNPTKFETYYFCWNSGDKRDNDNTDIAVAYACE